MHTNGTNKNPSFKPALRGGGDSSEVVIWSSGTMGTGNHSEFFCLKKIFGVCALSPVIYVWNSCGSFMEGLPMSTCGQTPSGLERGVV